MPTTLDFVRDQKDKIQTHLKATLAFLDKVPDINVALSLEILQLAALLVAGLQTCDEAIEAIASNNHVLKKTSLTELDMLQELLKQTIKSAQALEQVH